MMETEYIIDKVIVEALDIPTDELHGGKTKYGIPSRIMKKYLNNEVAVMGGVKTDHPFVRCNGVLEHNVPKVTSVKPGRKPKNYTVIPVGNNNIRYNTINDGEVLFDIQDMYKTDEYRTKHSAFITNMFERIAIFDFMHGKGGLTYSYVRLPSILYDNAYKMLDNPHIYKQFMLSFRGNIQMHVRQDNGSLFITQEGHKPIELVKDTGDVCDDCDTFFKNDTVYQGVKEVWEKGINVSAESNDLELMLKELMDNVTTQIVQLGDRYLAKSQQLMDVILKAVKIMDFTIRTFIKAYDVKGPVCDTLLLLNIPDDTIVDTTVNTFIVPLGPEYPRCFVVSIIDNTNRLKQFAIDQDHVNMTTDQLSDILCSGRPSTLAPINPDKQMNRRDILDMYDGIKDKTHPITMIDKLKTMEHVNITYMRKDNHGRIQCTMATLKPDKYTKWIKNQSKSDSDTTYSEISITSSNDGIYQEEQMGSVGSSECNLFGNMAARSLSDITGYRGSITYDKDEKDINNVIRDLSLPNEVVVTDNLEEASMYEYISTNPCIAYDFETQTIGSSVFAYNFSVAIKIPFKLLNSTIDTEELIKRAISNTIKAVVKRESDDEPKMPEPVECKITSMDDVIVVNGISLNEHVVVSGAIVRYALYIMDTLVGLSPSNLCIAHNGMKFDNLFIAACPVKGTERTSTEGTKDNNKEKFFTIDMRGSMINMRKLVLTGHIKVLGNTLKFVDSLKITQAGSLTKFTNLYAPSHMRKQAIDKDILCNTSLLQKVKHKDVIVEYAMFDSASLIMAMYNYYEGVNVAYDEVKHKYNSTSKYKPDAVVSATSNISQLIKAAGVTIMDTPLIMNKWFRDMSYFGGYCVVLPETELGKIYKGVTAIDITSAYPAIMTAEIPEVINDIIVDAGELILTNSCGYIHIRIDRTLTHFKDRYGALRPLCPMLKSHADGLLMFSHAQPNLPQTFASDTNEYVITTNTYRYFKQIGYMLEYEVLALWKYSAGTSLKPVVDSMYNTKSTADRFLIEIKEKGVLCESSLIELFGEYPSLNSDHDNLSDIKLFLDGKRATAKTIVNTLYGYFGINKEGEDNYGNYEIINNNRISCAIASWCTAENSLRLYKMINALTYIGCHVLYCDTDSVYYFPITANVFGKNDTMLITEWLYPKDVDNICTINDREVSTNVHLKELRGDIIKYSLHMSKADRIGTTRSERYHNSTGLGRWTLDDVQNGDFCVRWVKQYGYNNTEGVFKYKSSGFRFSNIHTLVAYANDKLMNKEKETMTTFTRPYVQKAIVGAGTEVYDDEGNLMPKCLNYKYKTVDNDKEQQLEAKLEDKKEQLRKLSIDTSTIAVEKLRASIKKDLLKLATIVAGDNVIMKKTVKSFNCAQLISSNKLVHVDGVVGYHIV